MKKIVLYTLLFVGFSMFGTSQKDCFPDKKDFTFVYDKASILDPFEEKQLNDKLRLFTKETSNVLVIVITNDLCGFEPVVYSYTFGEKVGVGRADLDNGVVLLVKPKTYTSKGQVFVAVGTGLQGAIPDIIAKRDLVERELIPNFKRNDYYGGISQASNVIIGLATGEINEKNYREEAKLKDVLPIIIFVIVIFVILYFLSKNGRGDDWENYDRNGKHRGRRRSSPWIIIGGGGGSGGGFSGGGFGGFGGGGFSGGGAGGSW